MKLKEVRNMYEVSKTGQTPLLSSYAGTFWQEYVSNYQRYDKLFNRTYLTFKYFMQDGSETVEDLTSDFTEAVYEHLLANHKKYDELYRVFLLADDEYSLVNNYDVTETMDRDTTSNNSNTYGERIDITNNAIGSQTNTSTGKVSPYDNENFYNDSSVSENIGTRIDAVDHTKGQQEDTLNNTGTENYTMTRKGNIGVQTVTDMITKHETFWSRYRFYTMIFENISKELLLV